MHCNSQKEDAPMAELPIWIWVFVGIGGFALAIFVGLTFYKS